MKLSALCSLVSGGLLAVALAVALAAAAALDCASSSRAAHTIAPEAFEGFN